jgi:hypothetical protein
MVSAKTIVEAETEETRGKKHSDLVQTPAFQLLYSCSA